MLGSWADETDPRSLAFSGTAVYRTTFDAPDGQVRAWLLDLGAVHESARVRLNGRDLGTLIGPVFRLRLAGAIPSGSDPVGSDPVGSDPSEWDGLKLGGNFRDRIGSNDPLDGRVRPVGNVLEIEVTNLSANRLRDLDRRKVAWRVFHDINVVNLDYQPLDASNWPILPSGLLGPVTLAPAAEDDGQ